MVTEQAVMEKIAQTHSTYSKKLDDFGNHWYSYEEYNLAPVGEKFNVLKLEGGMISFNLKDENSRVNNFVGVADKNFTYDKNFNTSGIPAVLKDKYLKDFDIKVYPKDQELAKDAGKRAKNYIRSFETLANDGMGLFIYSNAEGSGKTYLAAIVANEIMKRYQLNVKFIKANNFFLELKRSIGDDKDPYAKSSCLDSVIKAGILVIDDIGAGQQTPFVSEMIYEIVSKRVSDKKVTIITSKRSYSELAYDKSTLMLIEEKCLRVVLPSINVCKDIIKEKNKKYEDLLNA